MCQQIIRCCAQLTAVDIHTVTGGWTLVLLAHWDTAMTALPSPAPSAGQTAHVPIANRRVQIPSSCRTVGCVDVHPLVPPGSPALASWEAWQHDLPCKEQELGYHTGPRFPVSVIAGPVISLRLIWGLSPRRMPNPWLTKAVWERAWGVLKGAI